MLTRRSAATTGTQPRIRLKQAQVSAMEKVREGDKSKIVQIMEQGNLTEYGMSIHLSPDVIQRYKADMLYEVSYGGSIDYWRSPTFMSQRVAETQFVSNLIREINVVESIYICPACTYNRIMLKQEQIGGGDESMTTKYKCTKCGHEWTNAGKG